MIDRRLALLALALVLPLAGCKIVPIVDDADAPPVGFNAAAYVDGLWSSEALPYFSENARPIVEVWPAIMADLNKAGTDFGYRPGEGSPWAFVVSGSGTVAAKNTESRAGTVDVTVEGLPEPVVIQIGPVIRGNAVRDALPFVSFKDFTNQIEYADAGKALTAAAAAGVAETIATLAVGDVITFTGSVSLAGSSDRLQLTPVTLEKAAP